MATTVAQPASAAMTSPDYLIMSPYSKQQQLLDLGTIPEADQLLAKALRDLKPVRKDYQTTSYSSSFNWPTIIDKLRAMVHETGFQWKEMRLYVIIFRSLNPPSIDRKKLWALDEDAFTEALAGGGLYRYWCGEPDEDGNNLSTCIWRSQQHAQFVMGGRAHQEAYKAKEWYTSYRIERLSLIIYDDVSNWAFEA